MHPLIELTRGRRFTAVTMGLVLVVSSGAALAAPIDITVMSSNILPDRYYLGGADTEWNMDNVGVDAGFLASGLAVWWFDGQVTWVSDLDQDLSGLPPNDPGQANATFLGGGTLSITGTVYMDPTFMFPLFSGLLFEASVSAFELKETFADTNSLETIGEVIIAPNTGYLVDDPMNMLARMTTPYQFGLQFTGALSDGGNVSDFSSDIYSTGGAQWAMYQVPEPATMCLLSAGLCGLIARRRNRG